jgi:hypothetical protein
MENEIDDELDYWDKKALEYQKFLREKAIKLELNKVYLQESDSWAKKHYKIIFVDDKIAVGLKVWCGIYNSNTKNCGTYELFNVNTGEKYQDGRLCYRLKNEVKKD